MAAAVTLGVVPVVVAQVPALAAALHVCTAYGHNYCLGVGDLDSGSPIVNSVSGRAIILEDLHYKHGGFEVYRLQFADDTNLCVGFSSNGLAEVRDCNGDSNFTNWEDDYLGAGRTIWLNNSFYQPDCVTPNDQGDSLSSDNTLGDRDYCSGGGSNYDFEEWILVTS